MPESLSSSDTNHPFERGTPRSHLFKLPFPSMICHFILFYLFPLPLQYAKISTLTSLSSSHPSPILSKSWK